MEPDRPTSGPKKPWLSNIRRFFKHYFTFFYIHLLIFIVAGLVFGGVLYAIETGNLQPISVVDAFYLSFSALCVVGLTPVDVGHLRTGSIVLVALLMQFGNVVFVSWIAVIIRRLQFRRELGESFVESPIVSSSDAISRPSFELALPVFDTRILQYRAMGKLVFLIPLYHAIFYLPAFVLLSAYLGADTYARSVMLENGFSSAVGWSAFHIISAFNNGGIALFANSLVPFQFDACILLTLAILILVGFTLYPAGIRLLARLAQRFSKDKEAYDYLLTHPRECYTLMFPAVNTTLLVLTIVVLFVFNLSLIMGLDWNATALDGLSSGTKILVAIFQSVSTRVCGLTVIDLGTYSVVRGLLYLTVV
jgi:Trk-type K+ transport system membrane component